ncbi:peptidylprolyl isomerase [Larkinella terrae]|uniref:peptidylprolyl isomerase n=1 Tax=Larkinella terrae TaxID=2025311 RepID=UPI001E536B73|nr:peptidylprolyl isomerase [Larkinella terrae]
MTFVLTSSIRFKKTTGFFLLCGVLAGCKSSAPVVTKTPEPVILKLGNRSFTTDEFFQSFTKNQINGDSSRRTDLREYIDLYTNLKLKVMAAEQEGRDTTEGFREEIATYRKQLAQSYLNDKEIIEHLTAEAYERLKQEVNVSHILFPVADDAAPADTLKAYRAALDVRKQILDGLDFSTAARQFSKDPTAATNGGNLGYLTVFQVVYPIETAAYSTPVGSVSAPIRSRSGYHLVKVLDKRPSRGKVQVAHILVRVSPSAAASGGGTEGQKAARARIDEAYSRLEKGEPFDMLAKEFSDDRESRNTGGILPVFGVGQMVQPFEEAAYSLTQPGSYSKPFQSNYGWHIVRLIERQPLESFESMAGALRQKVVTDTRGEIVRQALVQKLRKNYTVTESPDVLAKTLALADSSLLMGKWKLPATLEASIEKKPIVLINKQPYTANEFLETVVRRQQPRRDPTSSATVQMERLFRRFVDDKIIEQEEAGLEKKYPEFLSLMNDIRDGVLLSQVMEMNVWEKSLTDSLGQRTYYEAHKEKYRYDQRAAASILVVPNDETLKQASDMLAKSPYQLRRSVEELSYGVNQSALNAKQRETLFDLVVLMIKNPDYLVEVSGSADGTERDTVSASRIRNVVSVLTANRIPIVRIMEKDHGKFRPGITGTGRNEKARRVTFQLFSTSKKDVEKILNSKDPGAVKLTEGLFTKGANPYLDAVDWQPGTKTIRRDGKVALVKIDQIDPARLKTFEEARGAVINDYQAVLEKQWLDRLKQQYPVQMNEEEVRKLAK